MAREESNQLKGSSIHVDALTFFTFLWSNIAVLQCVKHYHSVKITVPSLDTLLFFLLVTSVIFSTLQPHRSSALISLCFSHLISLVHHGSQSNHVIMAIVIASSALLSYSEDRTLWRRRLSGTTYLILITLYLVSWTHKLNENWFDRTVSCASLFASGFLSMWMTLPKDADASLASKFAELIIQTAPKQAVLVEILLPSLLIAWKVAKGNVSAIIFKSVMVVGALFHLIICLPLPPMSVYPFSMVMVPMYVLLLPSDSFNLINSLTTNIWVMGGAIALLSVSVQVALVGVLGGEQMPLEYPAYGLWTSSVVWNVLVWAVILYAALGTKAPSKAVEFPTFIYTRKGISVAAFLGFIGICPYLGVRNYPALAMFSNLRTEGSADNHLFLPPLGILNYQRDTVMVHSTNLKSLQNYQVNLAIYFSEHTKKFNTAFGVTNEFWITPPSWTAPDSRPAPFVSYSIPVLEFRKHVSKHIAEDFYVNFTRNSDTSSSMFYSSDPMSFDTFGDLVDPVPWFQRVIFRFRSFDSSYSPCRH